MGHPHPHPHTHQPASGHPTLHAAECSHRPISHTLSCFTIFCLPGAAAPELRGDLDFRGELIVKIGGSSALQACGTHKHTHARTPTSVQRLGKGCVVSCVTRVSARVVLRRDAAPGLCGWCVRGARMALESRCESKRTWPPQITLLQVSFCCRTQVCLCIG